MINEPDVAGKTPVDYASEGNSPRCCTGEKGIMEGGRGGGGGDKFL